MEQYQVTGMSCAACSARVEKAVSAVPGVTACSVSLLTNSMGVAGTASPAAIIKAVEDAGYGASPKKAIAGAAAAASDPEEALKDTETPKLKKRLLTSLGFLLALMYFSMGVHMWGWPVPSFLRENHMGLALLQMILSAIVMLINRKFFISGWKGLVHRAPNMDTLVAMGSGVSFAWSTAVLFRMTASLTAGNHGAVMGYMDQLYFESSAMIRTLITG